MAAPLRAGVQSARRVVIKVGTRVLTEAGGRIALVRMFAVVEAAARLRREGREVVIVSSGAVGLGREALGLAATPRALPDRQACAAVGQGRLIGLYEQGFARLGVVSAQVLLTRADLDDRARYLNLRSAFDALLGRGVVPIVNENDATCVEELACEPAAGPDAGPSSFGDNDMLSALVATKLGADLLVLLTDVAGVYRRDPREAPDAEILSVVEPGPAEAAAFHAGGPGSAASRGGMARKVEAASMAARAGCHAVIASGFEIGALERVLRGDPCGTWFPAGTGLKARRRWIAFAATPRGALVLDAGAVEALARRGASLLAAGVTEVRGRFARGDVVRLLGPLGAGVGRGVAACDADAARRWCAGEPPAGARNRGALIARDDLVLHAEQAL